MCVWLVLLIVCVVVSMVNVLFVCVSDVFVWWMMFLGFGLLCIICVLVCDRLMCVLSSCLVVWLVVLICVIVIFDRLLMLLCVDVSVQKLSVLIVNRKRQNMVNMLSRFDVSLIFLNMGDFWRVDDEVMFWYQWYFFVGFQVELVVMQVKCVFCLCICVELFVNVEILCI